MGDFASGPPPRGRVVSLTHKRLLTGTVGCRRRTSWRKCWRGRQDLSWEKVGCESLGKSARMVERREEKIWGWRVRRTRDQPRRAAVVSRPASITAGRGG